MRRLRAVQWWLILCVKLALACADWAQSLEVLVRVFLEEISTWMGGLYKVDCPSQCRWASSHLLGAWIEQKAEEGGVCPLFLPACLSWDSSSHLLPPQAGIYPISCPASQAFGLASLKSPACRQQVVGLLSLHDDVSHVLMIKFSIYLYTHLSLYLSCWFCFPGEPWWIQKTSEHSSIPIYLCSLPSVHTGFLWTLPKVRTLPKRSRPPPSELSLKIISSEWPSSSTSHYCLPQPPCA